MWNCLNFTLYEGREHNKAIFFWISTWRLQFMRKPNTGLCRFLNASGTFLLLILLTYVPCTFSKPLKVGTLCATSKDRKVHALPTWLSFSKNEVIGILELVIIVWYTDCWGKKVGYHKNKFVSFRNLKKINEKELLKVSHIAPWQVGTIFDSNAHQCVYTNTLLNCILNDHVLLKIWGL